MRTKVSINFKKRIYYINVYDKKEKKETEKTITVCDFVQDIKTENEWEIALKEELKRQTEDRQVYINTIEYHEEKERISVSRQKFIDMYYEGKFNEGE